MSEVNDNIEKKKRFRSPPYPLLDLKKAVERASALFESAQHHQVGVTVLLQAWGMDSLSGQVWRNAAALIQYGLLTDSGSGNARKFQISDIGRRILQDKNPDSVKRKEALHAAALRPMIHKELWDKFGVASGLADSVITTYLTLDRVDEGENPYSEAAADEVMQTYRASLSFAGISDSDTVTASETDKDKDPAESSSQKNQLKINVGDFVSWTSNGIDQFKSRKVEWISKDGSHLRVFGSPTGIPMTEVELTEELGKKTNIATGGAQGGKQESGSQEDITAYLAGKRLQITADVDIVGIEKLEKMLAKYKEILQMH